MRSMSGLSLIAALVTGAFAAAAPAPAEAHEACGPGGFTTPVRVGPLAVGLYRGNSTLNQGFYGGTVPRLSGGFDRFGFDRTVGLRQHQIRSRIETGRISGLLDHGEYAGLMNRFMTIANQVAGMRQSGRFLSEKERDKLMDRLGKLDQDVAAKLNNNRARYVAGNQLPYFGWF